MTIFADISNSYSVSGTGTISSPLNWSQFLLNLRMVQNEQFRIKGLRTVTESIDLLSMSNNHVDAWLEEPWRIRGQGNSTPNHNLNIVIGGVDYAPSLKNGIIELDILTGLDSAIIFGRGATKLSFRNLYLISRHHDRNGFGMIKNLSGGTSMYGCVWVATATYKSYQNILLLCHSYHSQFLYEGCVFTTNYDTPQAGSYGDIFLADGNIHLKDCVFDRPKEAMIGHDEPKFKKFENCQFDWDNNPTEWPGVNGTKTDFAYSSLGQGITILGDGNFSGYDRDMFGEPRSRVGCFSTYPIPSIPLPLFTLNPQSQSIKVGEPVILSVNVSGRYVTYQWRKGGEEIPGETEPSLIINQTQLTSEGSYDVVATNPIGSVASSPALLSIIPLPPVIVDHPTSISKEMSEEASFSVSVDGVGLEYQWRRNGENIPGEIASTLTISSVEESSKGLYDVLVTNGGGFVISHGAYLNINPSSIPDDGAFFSKIGNSVIQVVDILDGDSNGEEANYIIFIESGELKVSTFQFNPGKTNPLQIGTESTTPPT